MTKNLMKRGIALILSVAMLLSLNVLPVSANTVEPVNEGRTFTLEKTDFVPQDLAGMRTQSAEAFSTSAAETHSPEDIVRVSIVLGQAPALELGFSTIGIAENSAAIAYREELMSAQASLENAIETQALGGRKLDVVWHLTLAANLISANVRYGDIEAIKAVPGVQDVILENRYEPAVVDSDIPANPNMATSSGQIGSNVAWASGYTGAGSIVAIVDTGLDTDHEVFNSEAFDYAIEEDEKEGKTVDLLTKEEVAAKLSQLHISTDKDFASVKPDISKLYLSSKVPFAFNYIDIDYEVTHDNDTASEHGSHVAGIAAANRYVKRGDKFVKSLDEVNMQGVAPDAQILVMKVFGKGGGAYDSDYMVAIEDAITLGADSVNLSLGSIMAGFSTSSTAYQGYLDNYTNTDTVVVMSAGNTGAWANYSLVADLYADDVNFATNGSPGSFTNTLTVASVDNCGATDGYLEINGEKISYTESTVGNTGLPYNNPPISSLVKAGAEVSDDLKFVYVDGFGTPEEFAEAGVAGAVAICNRGGNINFSAKANAAAEAGAIAVIVVNNDVGVIRMDLTDYTGSVPVVSLTQADGELFKVAGTTTESGLTYYVGTLKVGGGLAAIGAPNDENVYTMSDYSSWGVGGSLELKPEIVAPGGNIYSVNGQIPGGQSYENMSGTSMAAPQITGMVAVVAQYVNENADLFADSGMTQRAIVNSLLMSTAAPIKDATNGNYYYSVIQQGSGLANVGDAVNANALISKVAPGQNSGSPDGKVKVELGEFKSNTITYDFNIKNFSEDKSVYTLNTELFTQALSEVETEFGPYETLSKQTTPIKIISQEYAVNGTPIEKDAADKYDVNCDGKSDGKDAQAVLEYCVGAYTGEEFITARADCDGIPGITTHDANWILTHLDTVGIELDPGEEAKVTVTVVFDTASLAGYVNGAYVEGYTFLNAGVNAEGAVTDVDYSIPLVGFYGDWTDASMYERIDYITYEFENYNYLYYDEPYTHVPYSGSIANALQYREAASGGIYVVDAPFNGMYGDFQDEADPYAAERLALRSSDSIYSYYYGLIRNAGAVVPVVENLTTGTKQIVTDSLSSKVFAEFFNENTGEWAYTSNEAMIDIPVSELGDEGDKLKISVAAVPEYYTKNAGPEAIVDLINNDSLGDGAYLTTELTIDDTAPEMLDASIPYGSDNLRITALDNQYVAAVCIYNNNGYTATMVRNIEDQTPGEPCYVEFLPEDFNEEGMLPLYNWLFGNGEMNTDFYLLVYDYAGNFSAYSFVEGGTGDPAAPSYVELPETYEVIAGVPTTLPLAADPLFVTADMFDWESSAPEIVAVNNGVVTGLNEGTAVVTATYAEDPTITASCEVTVVRLRLTLDGVLADADGAGRFFSWNLESPDGIVMGNPIDSSVFPSRATLYGDDGKFLVFDDGTSAMNLMAADGSLLQTAGWSTASPTPWAMTYSPLHGLDWVYGPYVFVADDPFTPTYMAFNLGSYASQFVAITSVDEPWEYELDGELYEGDYSLIAIDGSNNIWELLIYPTATGKSALLGSVPSDLVALPSGMDGIPGTSLVYGDDGCLYYALYRSASNTSEIYRLTHWIDEEAEEEGWRSQQIGTVGVGIWPASLFHVTTNAPAAEKNSVRYLDNVMKLTPADEQMAMPGLVYFGENVPAKKAVPAFVPAPDMAPVESDPVVAPELPAPETESEAAPAEPAPAEGEEAPATGTLNSIGIGYNVAGSARVTPAADSLNSTVTDDGVAITDRTVTITLRAEDTTNGKLDITYDPSQLVFANLTPLVDYAAFNNVKPGTVSFGFAFDSVSDQTANVAEVVFYYLEGTPENIDTTVNVSVVEDGADDEPTEPDVEIPIGDHDYTPYWFWDADLDGATATIKFVCSLHTGCEPEPIVVDGSDITSKITVEPTCEELGTLTYTAKVTVTVGGEEMTLTDTHDVAIPAIGHDYEAEFTFSEDGTTATVTLTCKNDETHKVANRRATVTSEVTKEATCEEKGETTYTATFTYDGVTYTDSTVRADIDAIGHDWSEPVFKFSDDYKTATATFTCANDETHVKEVEATVTAEDVKEATCTEGGHATYTATVEFEGETYTSEPVEVTTEATGHDWSEPVFKFSDDYKTATATFTCANDETHVKEVEATVTVEDVKEATCTEGGHTAYTATVEFEGETYTSEPVEVTTEATGHDWGEPVITFSEDGKTATATVTCKNDATHVETIPATVTGVVTSRGDCVTNGVTTYTATVEFNGKTYSAIKAVTDVRAAGHQFAMTVDSTGHWMVCYRCGIRINIGGHTFANGVCTTCGLMQPSVGQFVPDTPVDTEPVEVTTATESTDQASDDEQVDVNDTPDEPAAPDETPADYNPSTGIAFSVMAIVMAAAATVISKKR